MFHGPIPYSQPVSNFGGLVVEGPHPSAIDDMPGLINDVQPLRPSGVRVVGGIAHVVDSEGQWKFEARGEILGDRHPLLERFGLRVTYVILHVGFHLPFVDRMRLANVHGQKIRFVFVVVVNLNDVAHLAAERGSSKATEHQHQWTSADAFTNMKMTRAIERKQSRVRSIAAHP